MFLGLWMPNVGQEWQAPAGLTCHSLSARLLILSSVSLSFRMNRERGATWHPPFPCLSEYLHRIGGFFVLYSYELYYYEASL